MIYGPALALTKLEEYENNSISLKNTLFYAIKGDLLKKLTRLSESKIAHHHSLELVGNDIEKKHHKKKIQQLSEDGN